MSKGRDKVIIALIEKIKKLFVVLTNLKSKRVNKYDFLIGIDPGDSGGYCIYSVSEKRIIACEKNPITRTDWLELLSEYGFLSKNNAVAYIEKVQGLPKMGGAAMFSFGTNYEKIMCALNFNKIPIIDIRPQVWTKYYSIGTKASAGTNTVWKNKLKSKAQQLYPDLKVTLAVSDAILITNYGIEQERL